CGQRGPGTVIQAEMTKYRYELVAARPDSLDLRGAAVRLKVWCEIVALACELLAWMGMLALDGTARRWEPRRLRLRLFSPAARLAPSACRLRLRLPARWPLNPVTNAPIPRP